MTGARGIPGRKQMEDGHKREERRWRTDDLRFGLTTLAGDLPGPAGGDGRHRRPGPARRGAPPMPAGRVRHLAAIDEASVALERNANESLLMESLMVELSGMID